MVAEFEVGKVVYEWMDLSTECFEKSRKERHPSTHISSDIVVYHGALYCVTSV